MLPFDMYNLIPNMVGRRFGALKVLKQSKGSWGRGKSICTCRCDCGKTIKVTASNIKRGNSRSCGCARSKPVKHGGVINRKKTRLYAIYLNIKQLCYNPKATSYPYYGGKGVVICPEWQDFAKFKEWAYNNKYKDGKRINRKDKNGPYSPDNCEVGTYFQSLRRDRRYAKIAVKRIEREIEVIERQGKAKTGRELINPVAAKYPCPICAETHDISKLRRRLYECNKCGHEFQGKVEAWIFTTESDTITIEAGSIKEATKAMKAKHPGKKIYSVDLIEETDWDINYMEPRKSECCKG